MVRERREGKAKLRHDKRARRGRGERGRHIKGPTSNQSIHNSPPFPAATIDTSMEKQHRHHGIASLQLQTCTPGSRRSVTRPKQDKARFASVPPKTNRQQAHPAVHRLFGLRPETTSRCFHAHAHRAASSTASLAARTASAVAPCPAPAAASRDAANTWAVCR